MSTSGGEKEQYLDFVLSPTDVEKYLKEAPDSQYLATKITWIVLALILMTTVNADSTNQDTQMFEEAKTATTTAKPPPQEPYTRQPRYEGMRWREVIMYLTPSQIRALESGQGRIEAQTTSQFELPSAQLPDIPKAELPKGDISKPEPLNAGLPIEDPYKALQNTIHEEGQKLQREYENFEADRKHRIQLAEAVQRQSSNELSEAYQPHVPEQSAKKYPEFIHQLQLVPGPSPELQHIAQPENKIHFPPDNYAYLYFYPQGKPQNNPKLQMFYPEIEENRLQHLVYYNEKNQEHNLNPYLRQKFQIVPYEYGPPKVQPLQAHVEAQPLQAQQYEALRLKAHRLEAQQLDTQQLDAQQLESQLESQQLQLNKLETQQLKTHQLQVQLEGQLLQAQEQEAQPLKAYQLQLEKQRLQTHTLEAQQQLQELLEKQQFQTQKLEAQQQLHAHLEKQQLQAQLWQAHKFEAQELKAHHLKEQLEGQLLDAHQLDNQFKDALQHLAAQQHEEDKFKADLEGNRKEFKKLEAERLEAEKLKEKYEAHQREAQRLDDHLEAQQLKAEQDRAEAEKEQQHPFQFYGDLDPNKGLIYALYSPLLQRYNLEESLIQQKELPTKPKLEGGFVPLKQYAPKYNNDRYIKEVERVLRNIPFGKQNSLAKAAAIAESSPVLVKEEVDITKHPIHLNIKHVNVPVPAPYYVPVPEPFEVKVPQPYAVPLEIIRPVPFSIVKTEKLEIEKPVPFEVEKRVPYPVTKNVFVNVDKPYFIKKIVPVEIKKEIPVEIPIHKPQKLSIIRHVWEH